MRMYGVGPDGLEEREAIDNEGGDIAVVAFTVSGRRLVTGTFGGAIKIWDVDSAALLRVVREHRGPISRLASAVVDGEEVLFTGSRDGTVRSWWVESGEAWAPVIDHGAPVTQLALGAGCRSVGRGQCLLFRRRRVSPVASPSPPTTSAASDR